MRTCQGCGAELPADADPRRKWCREACRSTYKLRRAHEGPRALCADCGAALGVQARSRGNVRCHGCDRAQRRVVHEIKLDVIEGCWDDGWPLREIAAVLGRGDSGRAVAPEIDELRRRGRVGYRHRGYGAAA